MKKLQLLNPISPFANGKLLIIITLLFTLSSCLKDNNDNTVPQIAALSVVHASPGTQDFDFITDGRFVAGPFKYSQLLRYNEFYSGIRNISIYKANATANADTLRTGRINLEAQKYYTLFVVGAATAPEFLLVKDSIEAPAAGKARLRFINLSPDAGSFDLVSDGTTNLFSNTAYKMYTSFVSVDGNKTYDFEIKKAGATKASLPDVEIKSGFNYTIWAKGLEAATVDSLKTSITVQQN